MRNGIGKKVGRGKKQNKDKINSKQHEQISNDVNKKNRKDR